MNAKEIADSQAVRIWLANLLNEVGTEKFAAFISDSIDRSSEIQHEKIYRNIEVGRCVNEIGNSQRNELGWLNYEKLRSK